MAHLDMGSSNFTWWSNYRRVRRAAIAFVILSIPVIAGASWVGGWLGFNPRWTQLLVGLGCILYIWSQAARLALFRCPQCGNRFGGGFATKCRSCCLEGPK